MYQVGRLAPGLSWRRLTPAMPLTVAAVRYLPIALYHLDSCRNATLEGRTDFLLSLLAANTRDERPVTDLRPSATARSNRPHNLRHKIFSAIARLGKRAKQWPAIAGKKDAEAGSPDFLAG